MHGLTLHSARHADDAARYFRRELGWFPSVGHGCILFIIAQAALSFVSDAVWRVNHLI
jgi:hypothetical protein